MNTRNVKHLHSSMLKSQPTNRVEHPFDKLNPNLQIPLASQGCHISSFLKFTLWELQNFTYTSLNPGPIDSNANSLPTELYSVVKLVGSLRWILLGPGSNPWTSQNYFWKDTMPIIFFIYLYLTFVIFCWNSPISFTPIIIIS